MLTREDYLHIEILILEKLQNGEEVNKNRLLLKKINRLLFFPAGFLYIKNPFKTLGRHRPG
ncbi:MAG: hypothetical protein FH761_19290 [Firmicutes bacterium]|nr:hypothetical protein [Bacillota bacterium]